MADEDLVSQVRITGIDEANRQFTTLGETGQKAFEDIDDAATKSGGRINAALTGIRTGIQSLKQLKPAAGTIGSIDQLRTSFAQLSKGVQDAGAKFQTFQERTKRVVGVATGVAVGLIALARTAAKSYDEAGKSQDGNTQAQLRGIQANQELAQAEFNHQQNLRALSGEFGRGEITFEQYNAKLQDVNRSYKEQQKAAAFAANQAETLRIETERLTRAAAQTKAFDDLANKTGTVLAGSLISAGRAAGLFIGDLQKSLGPPIAAIVDRVTQLFEQNRDKIIATFDAVANAIKQFVEGGGVERTFTVIGQALSIIGTVITTVVIPAFNALMSVANGVAKAVNSVFGTEVSGAAIAVVAALGLFTGAFTIALALLKSVFGAVGLLVGGLRLLPVVLGGITLALRVLAVAFTALIASMGPLGLIFTALSLAAIAFAAAGGDITRVWSAVVTFFTTTLPQAVTGFFTNIIAFVQTSWAAMVANTLAEWQAIVTFFTVTLPTAITTAFATFSGYILSTWTNIVSSTIAIWTTLLNFFTTTLPEAIVGGLTSLGETVMGAWQLIVEGVIALWQSFVDFLANLPATILAIFTQLGQSIVAAFQDVVSRIRTFFSDILTAAKQYIQPVIDMVSKLAALLGGTSGGVKAAGGGAASGFAGGGRVRGPGTTTSDSIPAWLSRDEWVIRAKAVRKYGHGFLRALNNGTLDLGRIARFATGGTFTQYKLGAPAYANGGPVQSGRPITLNMPTGETFNMFASEEEATKVIKYAVKKQTRSTGRKPSYVGR